MSYAGTRARWRCPPRGRGRLRQVRRRGTRTSAGLVQFLLKPGGSRLNRELPARRWVAQPSRPVSSEHPSSEALASAPVAFRPHFRSDRRLNLFLSRDPQDDVVVALTGARILGNPPFSESPLSRASPAFKGAIPRGSKGST